jgi:hypothetical protein
MEMSDTSPEAAEVQFSIYRRMTGSQRLQIAIDTSNFVREIALTRLRSEHPDWADWQLKLELVRYAFGDQPLPPGLEEHWRAVSGSASHAD